MNALAHLGRPLACVIPRVLVAAMLVAAFAAPTAGAAAQPDVTLVTPSGDAAVPDALRPWIPWALRDVADARCPHVDGETACLWPGEVSIAVDGQVGSFAIELEAAADLYLPLPGDARSWPVDVEVDGVAALMSPAAGTPRVRVARGAHRVTGRFAWQRVPEALPLPGAYALVALRLDGTRIEHVRREPSGAIWLNAAPTDEDENDSLAVDVWRRFLDGVPMGVVTRVRLRVGGNPREVDLGVPLPAPFEVWRLDSPLPARLDEEGHLRVQLRAGEWVVEVSGAALENVAAITATLPPEPWPRGETWSFVANDGLRSVRLTGASPVDPARTSLPGEWRDAPAFALSDGDALAVTELRRGEPSPPPPALSLSRMMWLDRDGRSLIVQDNLSGSAYEGGRINVAAPADVGRIALGGSGQVVTTFDEATGVELRSGLVSLSADLRYDDASGQVPAVGWDQDVQSLSVTLQLPPGWRLLAATGPDEAAGAWIDRWSLYDLFVLLVTVVVAARMFGPLAAVALLLVVGTAWHEPSAVRGLWLGALVATAIARAAPAGRLQRFARLARVLTAVALALAAATFAWVELRTGLFPSLEAGDPRWGVSDDLSNLATNAARDSADYYMYEQAAMAPPPEATRAFEELDGIADRGGYGGEVDRRSLTNAIAGSWDTRNVPTPGRTQTAQIDPNAVVQTGQGIPSWSWRIYTLSWAGPVTSGETFHLWLLPPALDLPLSLFRSLGALALALLFLGGSGAVKDALRRVRSVGTAAGAGLLFAAVLGAAPPDVSASELPTPEQLNELRAMLLRPPQCAPACAETPAMAIAASPQGLRVDAEVHVEASTGWRLPGPDSAWMPTEVTVDGAPTTALFRDASGYLLVRLEPGRHRVAATGPAAASVALQFAPPPRTLTWSLDGWTLDGYQASEPPPPSVILRRVRAAAATDDAPEIGGPSGVAPMFAVTRTLDLGVPWMTHTSIARIGKLDETAVVRVPLLAGERVTTPNTSVDAGSVVASFAPGVGVIEWDATLAESESVSLTATQDAPFTETWSLLCSPVWHCSAAGLVPTVNIVAGSWAPVWNPWPGETVDIALARPTPIDGASLAIDSAELTVTPGRRVRTATLDLSIRASRGGEQQIRLDSAAEVRSFSIDGAARPFELVDGVLAYSLEPGTRAVQVSWQEDVEASAAPTLPRVEVGAPVANVRISVQVPPERWVVWTAGGTWGPVVQFWEFALLLLVFAVVLSRTVPAPLGVVSWFLLGLGLTQVGEGAALALLAWFALLASRPAWRVRLRPLAHNAVQVFAVVLTLIAAVFLLKAVASGLALRPPTMHVGGGGSSDSLLIWTDYSTGETLPQPTLVWLPMWAWRVTMLAWSAWLAFGVVRWARWGWARFNDGGLWARWSALESVHSSVDAARSALASVKERAVARAAATPASDAADGSGEAAPAAEVGPLEAAQGPADAGESRGEQDHAPGAEPGAPAVAAPRSSEEP
ncbi:MAG: hypothetical protein H6700_02745 [Myxococcales bacterium]|nr:hypothetical protein [Myxococcales bacterium]MCB9519618.1 hypothetical protein [Myxococcales bacterium]MCB9530658.1 hypothetical protein [Myxococcales bacterium]